MAKRVFLATGDLVFRARLARAVAEAGAAVSRDETACDLAVVPLDTPGALERIARWVARGVPVLAYGAHTNADLLRAARQAGATAVPNSAVLRELGRRLRA
jgi:hypothetical protein